MQIHEPKVEEGGGDVSTLSTEKKKFQRKSGKKARFLGKAKKFAKQGKLGRGFEIDSETYNYFVRVLELWQKNEFQSDEERESFIENSFEQTTGHEVDYSSNQMTSRVLETILPHATEEILSRFTSAFSPSLRTICSDPFASHVLEKLLEVTSSDKWATESKKLPEWFRQTSQYVLNNLEDFTFDPYANHVMRKVSQCLAGLVTPTGQGQSLDRNPNYHPKNPKKETDSIFGERQKNKKNEQIFTDFFQRFLAWPQFFDLFQSELTSGLVQIVLKTCSRIDSDLVQRGVDNVLKALGDTVDLGNNVQANLYTRMVEACLGVGDEQRWMMIYRIYFQGKLNTFGVHEKGKFSLKKLIETCPKKDKFEQLFDEIVPKLEELYKVDSASVFIPLAEGCKKFQTKQSQFLDAISSILGYGDGDKGKENFVLCLARFGRKLVLKEDGSPKYWTDYVGTMVLQQIMEFHKPLKVISSILELDGPTLTKLTTDPKGSHITDSFYKSGTVGEKNKDKLLQKFKEHMVELALNKFGSRVLDNIWAWANIKQKGIIAASLSERIAQLNDNFFGKFLSEKCALQIYKRDPKIWAEAIEKGEKRKKEAEDIFDEMADQVTPKKKKDKKKVKNDEIKTEEVEMDQEEPERKKKSKRKSKFSETEAEVSTISEDQEDTPKKKKKRKSARVEEPEIEEDVEVEEPAQLTQRKRKSRA